MVLGFPAASSSLSGILRYVAPAWVAWIMAGLLLNSIVRYKSTLPKLITDVMEYGKLREKTRGSGGWSWNSLPKRWFTHFYIWGTMWILSITVVYFNSCILPQSPPIPLLDDVVTLITGGFLHHQCQSMKQQHVDIAVVLGMLSVQVLRRLYECLFVSVFSDSRIHLGHYVLGMFFYFSVPLTALLHLDVGDSTSDSSSVASFRWNHVVAMCLFVWASHHQHVCHRILAGLRGGRKKGEPAEILAGLRRGRKGEPAEKGGGRGQGKEKSRESYGRPDGDWFELVSCPHFFAEILIYVSLLLCCVWTVAWSSWWLVVVQVTSTLGLSARQAHEWYQRKFDDYPKDRRAIIPWVW